MADPIRQLEPDEGARMVAESALLLDVREDDEWAAGHVPEATHIRLSEIPHRVEEVPRDREVVVICRSGARSQRAAEFLAQQGVVAHNLAGGMRAWAAAGYDVVAADGLPGAVI